MLRIDPRLPLAWTSPTTVRIGIQTPIAIINDVDDDTAALLDRMRRGVVESEPAVVLGMTRASRLLTQIAPALETTTHPKLTLRVLGSCSIATDARRVLERDGHTVSNRKPDLVVAVAHWRLPEIDRQRLLHRDSRHLTITIGDQRVDVGPYTVPGHSACARCVMLADPDDFIPVSLPPSVDVPASTATQVVASIAAIVNAIANGAHELGSGVHVDLATGVVTAKQWLLHERCGCQFPPGTEMALAIVDQKNVQTTSAGSA